MCESENLPTTQEDRGQGQPRSNRKSGEKGSSEPAIGMDRTNQEETFNMILVQLQFGLETRRRPKSGAVTLLSARQIFLKLSSIPDNTSLVSRDEASAHMKNQNVASSSSED
jgi:hypothetical protein